MLFSSSVVPHSLPPMNCSMPGFPVLHYFPEVAEIHVHWVSEASLTWCIQTSDPLSSPSPPAFSLSQHQGLSQWVGSLHQVASDVASHIMGWGPFVFDPQGAFLPMCSVWEWDLCDLLIFYSESSSSVSARAVILKCPQETKPDYLPCYSYSISKCKPEADCKHLDSSPLASFLRKCKAEASCKCLALQQYDISFHLFTSSSTALIRML